MPSSAGMPRFDHRADVTGAGARRAGARPRTAASRRRVPAPDSDAAGRRRASAPALARNSRCRRRCATGWRVRSSSICGGRSRLRPKRWRRSRTSSPTSPPTWRRRSRSRRSCRATSRRCSNRRSEPCPSGLHARATHDGGDAGCACHAGGRAAVAETSRSDAAFAAAAAGEQPDAARAGGSAVAVRGCSATAGACRGDSSAFAAARQGGAGARADTAAAADARASTVVAEAVAGQAGDDAGQRPCRAARGPRAGSRDHGTAVDTAAIVSRRSRQGRTPPLPPVRDITELIASDDLHLNRNDAPQRGFEDERVEAKPQAKSAAAKKKRAFRLSGKLAGAIAAAVVAVAAVGYFAMRKPAVASDAGVGTLDVQSIPAGVQVFIDGERSRPDPRTAVAQAGRAHPRAPRARRAARDSGQRDRRAARYRSIWSSPIRRPPGSCTCSRSLRAHASPLTVSIAAPRRVTVVEPLARRSRSGAASPTAAPRGRSSASRPAATASLVAPVGGERSAGPVSGWVPVKAPVSMEIREGGKLIGTSDADRLMLAAGRHDLEIVNETLGYRATRVVQVPPGKVAPIKIDLPQRASSTSTRAVGRGLDRRAARRRDADRQPERANRAARSRVQEPAARRKAARNLGIAGRAGPRQHRHEISRGRSRHVQPHPRVALH